MSEFTTLVRPRVSARLTAASAYPVTLVNAPAGYGKSCALDDYLRDLTGVVRFNVRRPHGSLARFVRALAAALEPQLPQIGQSLAIAYERARQAPDASDVLSAWLAEHLGGRERLVVIDDFHHCEGDRAISRLIAGTVKRTRGTVRWILATRSTADLPFASWLAQADAGLPVDEASLRLTESEALELAARVAPAIDTSVVRRLLDVTNAVPGIFTFGLRTIAQDPKIAERLLTCGGDPFERFADEVLRRFAGARESLLVESAAFAEIDEALIDRSGETAATFASIFESAPQIVEYRDGRRRIHGLFASSLAARLHDLGSGPALEASIRAARALEHSGRISEALAAHIRERQDAEIVRMIEAHGFSFLEAGYGESIHEAIEALDPLVQMTSSAVLAIKAMSESAIGRFDTAESWFQLALDRSSGPIRAQIAYQYGSHLLRFFRSEAVTIFTETLADANVPAPLRAYVLAALGPAYVFERRFDEARVSTDAALELARDLGAPHLMAKTHHQASYVALYAGDARRAKELASVSLAIASEHGYFDIAASALSVLYNVACDIEDDPIESKRLLSAMGECAAKSGSLFTQISSLVSVLEIEVEGGDDDAAALIDAKLQALDVTFAGRSTYEVMLPMRALQAAWAGDFTGAYRLLSSSADLLWSADRKALRHAEIATYAAAAGLEREASQALRSASELLAGIEESDLRVQRARLFLALAAVILGRTEAAAERLATVDADPTPLSRRLLVLRRTVGALRDRYRGERNENELLAYLEELSSAGFAGLSRAIAVLPLDDNAVRRAGRLTASERALLLRFADGETSAFDEHWEPIARKLGCAGRDAVLRAVRWHRECFERPALAAASQSGVA